MYSGLGAISGTRSKRLTNSASEATSHIREPTRHSTTQQPCALYEPHPPLKTRPPDARSDSQPQEQPAERTADPSSLLAPSHSFGTPVHALPPKPVLSSVPFVHPSHPSITEATAMASRADRDKRNNGGSKPEYSDPLPPGWEIGHPHRPHPAALVVTGRPNRQIATRPRNTPLIH